MGSHVYIRLSTRAGVYLIVLATSVFYTAPIVFWIDSFMPVGGAVCDFVLVSYAGSLSNYEL